MIKATWDEALALAAASLRSIQKEFGPQALGVLTSAKGTNEENYLLMKLGRGALGTNNVDHVARLCHAPTVAGLGFALGSGAMTGSISSLENSDAILVVGSNTTEQHPLVASYILRARSRGAKLIVVDPRKTHLAELADLWLSPRPGTDVVWINCLLNIIVAAGPDRSAVHRRAHRWLRRDAAGRERPTPPARQRRSREFQPLTLPKRHPSLEERSGGNRLCHGRHPACSGHRHRPGPGQPRSGHGKCRQGGDGHLSSARPPECPGGM